MHERAGPVHGDGADPADCFRAALGALGAICSESYQVGSEGGPRQASAVTPPSPRGGLLGHGGGRSIPACAGLTPAEAGAASGGPVHPRVRGAHVRAPSDYLCGLGPSPRALGSLGVTPPTSWRTRSIPACAGLTGSGGGAASSCPVHPRVRGAHDPGNRACEAGAGPSPRARGSHHEWFWAAFEFRSIPACAGLTASGPHVILNGTVHPRVRGAHRVQGSAYCSSAGPSPRARGSRPRRPCGCGVRRSIPACAGLTE